MSNSNDLSIAHKIAHSKISRISDTNNKHWIDICLFFCNNPQWEAMEIDDIFDYIISERQENSNWSISKRTLESIKKKSDDWHRAQFRIKKIGNDQWDGMGFKPQTFTTGKSDIVNPHKSTLVRWTITELRSSKELQREGNIMRHCVYSYHYQCKQDRTSIFSLKSENEFGKKYKNVTIEVDVMSKQVVQVRGYANRPAQSPEKNIINHWMGKNFLHY